MTEAFLHYIWQFQYFNKTDLYTTSGNPVNIIHPGLLNTDSGPDFQQARIRIAEVDWVGSVEMHINSEGWNEHKHGHDPAYENVILHVVWENKKPIARKDGSELPTIVLKNRIGEALYGAYLKIMRSPADVPCENQLRIVTPITKVSMLEKVTTERLQLKSQDVKLLFEQNNNDWEETAYQYLAANFGFKVNNEAFYQLSKVLPYKIIQKHLDKQIQVEALLLGMSGLLPAESDDDYLLALNREFKVLSHKYDLSHKQLKSVQWRLLRLRPSNFPSLRLMQFAALLNSFGPLFSGFTEFTDSKALIKKLSVKQSAYWELHYLPGKKSVKKLPGIGKSSIDNIIINTVVPLLVLYGKSRDEQVYIDKALELLQELKVEDNRIVRRWKALDWKVKNAFDSQALIGLYNNYCLKRRCLQCNIGSSLVRP